MLSIYQQTTGYKPDALHPLAWHKEEIEIPPSICENTLKREALHIFLTKSYLWAHMISGVCLHFLLFLILVCPALSSPVGCFTVILSSV